MCQHGPLGATRGATGVLKKSKIGVIHIDRLVGIGITGQHPGQPDGIRELERRNHSANMSNDEINQPPFQGGQHFTQRSQNNLLKGRAFFCRLYGMRKVLGNNNYACPRIGQLKAQFVGGVQGVHVHHHSARQQGTEKTYRVLQKVGHHQGDTIAFDDAT